ncbi:iron transporter [bacterium]|nr:iron transporter [bacterium]
MLVTFLIMLREGIEAALIIGIMAGYSVRRGRAQALPSIWAGALAALVTSAVLAGLLLWTKADFPQRIQELFEVVVAVVAIVVLLSMVFWMRRAGRTFKAEIERTLDRDLQRSSGGFSLALFLSAFLIVGREGVESVMFLVAILQQATGPAMLSGALLGLAAAVLAGAAIFRLGVRLNLARFFRWTGVVVIFIASGLAAQALRALHEAGLWNELQGTAFDLSAVLPGDGVLGSLLSGIFGYSATPSWGEVLVYLMLAVPSLVLFLRPARPILASRPA